MNIEIYKCREPLMPAGCFAWSFWSPDHPHFVLILFDHDEDNELAQIFTHTTRQPAYTPQDWYQSSRSSFLELLVLTGVSQTCLEEKYQAQLTETYRTEHVSLPQGPSTSP